MKSGQTEEARARHQGEGERDEGVEMGRGWSVRKKDEENRQFTNFSFFSGYFEPL